MMKKFIILLISISFIVINADAQTFATNDAEWVFDYPGGHSHGITIIKYSKDTLIGDREVRIFTKEAIRTLFKDTLHFLLNPIYIYSSNGVVEYSLDKVHFDTLINYNAQIGQSWMLYRHTISDSIKFTVLDTFRTRISGKNLFTQQIRWTHYHGGERNSIDTVYDQIGLRYTYIFPFDGFDVPRDGGEGGIVRCFKNNELGIVSFYNKRFQGDFIYDCDDLTYVKNEKPSTFDYTLTPNPAMEYLNIGFELNRPKRIRLELSNSLGIHISTLVEDKYKFGQHTKEVSISHLPEGVYYCSLFVDDKNVGVKKLIVVK